MQKRPPIVVILGSVDHGKTTLLDHIRKTNLAAREAGGITQAVGAYEIEHISSESKTKEKITFIDTPGHEAFTKMRSRGANIADIGILVVAADDGVKPQTQESIKILTQTETPFIVAINKVDRPGIDIERVKNGLMQAGVALEGYGGTVSFQPISAKTGAGINELLDLVLLTAEMENLTYDPQGPLEGVILESFLDRQSGIIATAILKNGSLKIGDEIQSGTATARVRTLQNFLGQAVSILQPSSPAIIGGFNEMPKIGEILTARRPKEAAAPSPTVQKSKIPPAGNSSINLILKADVSGTLEALLENVKILANKNVVGSKPSVIHIVFEGVGDITDGDVKLAVSTKSIIIGFGVRTTKAAENLARAQNVVMITSDIIYELLKSVADSLENLKRKLARGRLEILAVFGEKDAKQIFGGRVTEGEMRKSMTFTIERRGKKIGNGKIVNLQQAKKDAESVPAPNECGIMTDTKTSVRVGDIITTE